MFRPRRHLLVYSFLTWLYFSSVTANEEACCGPFDEEGNGYGEFVSTNLMSIGQSRTFSIQINYTSEGITAVYPNVDLPCGYTEEPITPIAVSDGHIEYIERMEYGSCIDGGTVKLTRDDDDQDGTNWNFFSSGIGNNGIEVVTQGKMVLTCTNGNECPSPSPPPEAQKGIGECVGTIEAGSCKGMAVDDTCISIPFDSSDCDNVLTTCKANCDNDVCNCDQDLISSSNDFRPGTTILVTTSTYSIKCQDAYVGIGCSAFDKAKCEKFNGCSWSSASPSTFEMTSAGRLSMSILSLTSVMFMVL